MDIDLRGMIPHAVPNRPHMETFNRRHDEQRWEGFAIPVQSQRDFDLIIFNKSDVKSM